MKKLPSTKIIILSLFLGLITGSILTKSSTVFGFNVYEIVDVFGQVFLNALKMIVIPLIMSSLIFNIAKFENVEGLSLISIKTVLFYILSSFAAILIGITIVNLVSPGLSEGIGAGSLLGLNNKSEIDLIINSQNEYTLSSFFLKIFSGNIFTSIASGNMLFIILFSILIGISIRSIKSKSMDVIKDFWEGTYLIFIKIMYLILFFTPFGIFFLVTKASMSFEPESYVILSKFFLTVISSLMIHMFVFYSLILMIFKVNVIKHFKGVSQALLVAFSTSSSVATIPVTSRCLIEKLSYKEDKVNFIIPIGATINMDGTALFECVVVIFIAQLYGIDLSFIEQLLILLLALITSIGVAGIPSASFVAIIVILGAVGLPFEAVGIIIGIDRLLDMLRTSVNVYGDTCCVSIVAK
tara:strand:+ start:528 stop:1760 length:1233 start_codon:yes stop_codon:yes gene_type:complete